METFLQDLLAHAEWANAAFFHAWGESPARDHEDIRRRVAHVLDAQDAFLAVLRGETAVLPTGAPPAPYGDLFRRAVASHAGVNAFAAALRPAETARPVRFPWFPEPPCVTTVGEALVQVALHAQHHRGQCMTRLKDLGGDPKNVDWIIWLWQRKPAPRWG